MAIVDPGERSLRIVEGLSPIEVARAGVTLLIGRDDEDDVAGQPLPLDSVEFLAPIPRPARNIFCVGKNYREHAAEFGGSGFDATGGGSGPTRPVIFTKAPSTVVGDGAAVLDHPVAKGQLDYEAELAVVIGTGGRGIARDEAYAHVWGYTAVNDVTARGMQRDHQQWFLGKSLDTFCPMGPFVVTADEFALDGAVVGSRVNGELRQAASVDDLIFDIPTLIATISAAITLEPGDVIATGTPAGVGIGFNPPRFLVPGDVVEVFVSGIGTLTNPITAV